MPRKPAEPDSAQGRFAALLAGHLSGGTRPARSAGEPWTDAGFAREVPSGRDNDYVSPRTVSNWRKGTALPDAIEPVLRALFGPEGNPRHADAREALRKAFLAARHEKAALVVARAKRDPAGGLWIPEGDHFTLDRTRRPTDARAAADPVRRQLQRAICAAAADLAGEARRLGNSRTWKPLPATAEMLCAIVQGEPQAVLDQLGEAYAALLRLGRFLDTDTRLQNDPGRHDEPLDADLHGLLTDLVRLAAPWLRGFPTVAALDDAAGRFLAREDLFQPARDFARVARDRKAITDRDAAELGLLGDTAAPDDFQGAKAGARAVGHTGNLILAGAEALALARLPGTEADPDRAGRAETARAMLAAGKAEVDALSASWPDDLRHALRLFVEEGPAGARAALPGAPAQPVPDDVEAQARAMILEGRAPPAEWRPFLHDLNFAFTQLDDLKLLAGLTTLRSLDLMGTQVSDLSPLVGLTTLQSLYLMNTQVSDLSPLAGLTTLQSLDLRNTQVSDLSPLAGLTTLQSLDLSGTQVSDLSVLAGLTTLRSLDLMGTQVSDLSPLAGLTSLQSLDLRNTQVSDLSVLAGLTTLQSLTLMNTQVSDLSVLAGLTTLRSLTLMNIQVSDLSPLAGLTTLQSLDLSGTQVSDLSVLAGLTTLQSLDLSGTQVSDLSPLAGLTTLQSLDLSGTQVSDLSVLAGLTTLQSLDLSGTQVSDLSVLAGLTTLQSLDLRNTQVSDLSVLAGLTTLQSLDLRNTQVSDLSVLAGLTTLQSLTLSGTQVSD
ncbi:leucine-rich repeat domain-containing protein [Methylobacterium oryzihabitans]|uniref:Internalin-A n=1 Tax=Methylobacterium oryzihabitans TaxID=2499852 RepID=A0A3S3UDM0_9HYPH|nr:leucine-rich repeat domain-containing protein [Methylobacterium oryzihabitans]RVU21606.1 hypothetical protein EOE48_00670 [Methylobacterium oryzihabitans]